MNAFERLAKWLKDPRTDFRERTFSLLVIMGEIFTVTDTGIGIRKEDMFSAFTRVDEQRNRHIEGTGLGLSIVNSGCSGADEEQGKNKLCG